MIDMCSGCQTSCGGPSSSVSECHQLLSKRLLLFSLSCSSLEADDADGPSAPAKAAAWSLEWGGADAKLGELTAEHRGRREERDWHLGAPPPPPWSHTLMWSVFVSGGVSYQASKHIVSTVVILVTGVGFFFCSFFNLVLLQAAEAQRQPKEIQADKAAFSLEIRLDKSTAAEVEVWTTLQEFCRMLCMLE